MKYAPTHSLNDNDADSPLPFVSLAALTANVITYLSIEDEKDEAGAREDRERRDRERDERERTKAKYIEQRAREIAAFERRARGLHR